MTSSENWQAWRQITASGDDQSIKHFWDALHRMLHRDASQWLARMTDRTGSGDVAAAETAFDVFCRSDAGQNGQTLRGADELWRLSAAIVMRRLSIADSSGRMPTDGEAISTICVPNVSCLAIPDDLALRMISELQRLVRLLADVDLESVVLAKLQGVTDEELASKLGYTRRTIQRMLKLIRGIWQDELN